MPTGAMDSQRRAVRGLFAVLAAALLSAWPVHARPPDEGASSRELVVGIAVLKTPQAYLGADEEWIVVPILQYRQGGFFADGIRLGYGFSLRSDWSLQLAVMPQFAELDPDSSPFLEGMERRRGSVDGMLTGAWQGEHVTASLTAASDLLGRSHGQRLEGQLGFPLTAGGWRIAPAVKAVWADAGFVDYYVGVRPAEARLGRPVYRGSSTLNPGAAIGLQRTVGEKSVFIAHAETLFLGSGVRDSPIVGSDTMSVVLLGVGRRF